MGISKLLSLPEAVEFLSTPIELLIAFGKDSFSFFFILIRFYYRGEAKANDSLLGLVYVCYTILFG
ncbi:hypothetical protein BCR33DRAFT_722136 [Rhizoclosmatium globosum]|uniref:Uncharacterized protein n=1 Tax=Rhizoclosmatium globosum TaxID=329046 RepID=A0A1Y2BNK0_9FUNG|nr:hypothetical protein BCR33DRAFT_722128 [Rhizoclosmatium globosum]ORY36328.1 hypothetical protein BCR33DRAFT_722130 [Rhizoclosmatium globosum]ORY36330.1 hypothetical protein BCR33DRAFT_722133 [Rhizoclosmatium globosum]ORY36332.1 hypothetical protein BCR33DRAFT_722136 [Rhizoclosmatium globosum]|eukprot:ORY36326.1 hypothetical protein BCR33DRAFT_722128 [Rhizoclosmatium globosum]